VTQGHDPGIEVVAYRTFFLPPGFLLEALDDSYPSGA
jgi:hypothetical protein